MYMGPTPRGPRLPRLIALDCWLGQSADTRADYDPDIPGVRGYVDARLGHRFPAGGHGEMGEFIQALGLLAESFAVVLGIIKAPDFAGDLSCVIAGIEMGDPVDAADAPLYLIPTLGSAVSKGAQGAGSGYDYSFFFHSHISTARSRAIFR
jgi:hypothetical protein